MEHERRDKTRLATTKVGPFTAAVFAQHARRVVAHHGEQILAEVPRTLRRLGTLFVVLSITIPAFLAGLLAVLWYVAR